MVVPVLRNMPDVVRQLVNKIAFVVDQLPNEVTRPDGTIITALCHDLSYALASVLEGVEAQSGLFLNFWKHSWLIYGDWIIDPFPAETAPAPLVTTGQVGLVMYRPNGYDFVECQTEAFWQDVLVIAQAIRELLSNYWDED